MSQPRTQANGQIVKPAAPAQANGNPLDKPLDKLLQDAWVKKEIARAVPRFFNADRMLRVSLTALKSTPNLERCTSVSFLGCMLQASLLGLEPNTPLGQCYLIPRLKSPKYPSDPPAYYYCTLIIGYQGMLELSARSERVIEVMAMAVREGDHFRRRMGLRPLLEHEFSDEADREDQPITHVWALARLKNGGEPWISLSRAQIDARRSRSSSRTEGPWFTDYEAMAQKTAIRALWKFLPKSTDLAMVEQLEVADELGKPQASAFDARVHDAMVSNGVQPTDEPAETPPAAAPGDAAPSASS